ncbi:hypothetical protein K439DRAFT_1645267 [Ramaria rubella]|nr:hypothetical protein K439DRAFT_1645267 [Ramaria rubella]
MIKERKFSVLVEYVPISHSPNALGEMKRIEGHSGLGQKMAHLIAKLNSIEAANMAIRDGLIIAGRRCSARCMKKEPRQCLKCQELNPCHLTASCPTSNKCGTCGEGHHTSECTNKNEGKQYCANCMSDDHPSWSQMCPKFIDQCLRLEA